jgi:ATP-dependent DNA helicase RecQ
MDIVRGKLTERVQQFGHDQLAVFGKGAAFSEQQLRATLRQLVAMGHVFVDTEQYNSLKAAESARPVLKGEATVMLREQEARAASKTRVKKTKVADNALASADEPAYAALKAWRAELARSHDVPAYVIFHDSTLRAIAQQMPASLDALAGISGIGEKKLQAYGEELLRIVAGLEVKA